MKCGFIGLGAMGKPMSANLSKAGYELIVFDANPKAVEAAAVEPIQAAKNNGHVAENAEVIFLSLPNAAIVGAVVDEILAAENPMVRYIIDMSTIDPNSSRAFAEKSAKKGIRFLDCPVSGGVSGAASGKLTIMVGSDEEGMKEVADLLDVLGGRIFCTGKVGNGAASKMLNNYLAGVSAIAVCEVIPLAKKLDMDIDNFLSIVNASSGKSAYSETQITKFLANRDFTPGFTLDLFHKDISLSMETSKKENFPLFMGAAVQQCMELARGFGYGKEDIVSVIKVYEQLAGVQVN